MTDGASSAGLVAMTKGAGASRALVMELVEGEDLSAPVWSPDGQELAYEAGADRQIVSFPMRTA